MAPLTSTDRNLASRILLLGTTPVLYRRAVLHHTPTGHNTSSKPSSHALGKLGVPHLNRNSSNAHVQQRSSSRDSPTVATTKLKKRDKAVASTTTSEDISGVTTRPSSGSKKPKTAPESTPPLPRFTFTEMDTLYSWFKQPAHQAFASHGLRFLPRSRGLSNEGNTCFLNSLIQCLSHLDPFVCYLKAHGGSAESGAKPTSALHRELWELVQQIRTVQPGGGSQQTYHRPIHFLRCFHLISKSMRLGRQEDSHELLVALFDRLQTYEAGKSFVDFASLQTTGLSRLFASWMRGRVQWSAGVSDTFEPFNVWSLEPTSPTLPQCMETSCAKEMLAGENAYCTPENKYVEAERWLQPYTLPPLLVIHLKRFRHDVHHGAKIQKRVSFPLSLRLKEVPASSQGDGVSYALAAVNVHSGALLSCGHYYSYCKNPLSGSWFRCDDASVSVVSEDEVLGTQAYILFYQRVDLPCQLSDANTQAESKDSYTRSKHSSSARDGTTTDVASPLLPKNFGRHREAHSTDLRSQLLGMDGSDSIPPYAQDDVSAGSLSLPSTKKKGWRNSTPPMAPLPDEPEQDDGMSKRPRKSCDLHWNAEKVDASHKHKRESVWKDVRQQLTPELGQVRDEEWESALDAGRKRKKGKQAVRVAKQAEMESRGNVFQQKALELLRARQRFR